MLPCQGTCNQYVDFEVLITAPEGYIINDTNYTGAVTWNTNRLKCAFEPCTLQAPNPCLLQTINFIFTSTCFTIIGSNIIPIKITTICTSIRK